MTPAIDLVKKCNIAHTIHSYSHDPSTASYGSEAAESLDIDAKRVFKTLVVKLNSGELAVGVVPVSGSLNLKSIAKATNAKKATMADKQEVQRITGYVLGGISPLGQKKQLVTVIDSSAYLFASIFISAGKRGLEIELSAENLKTLTDGQFAAIASHS